MRIPGIADPGPLPSVAVEDAGRRFAVAVDELVAADAGRTAAAREVAASNARLRDLAAAASREQDAWRERAMATERALGGWRAAAIVAGAIALLLAVR